MDIDTIEQLTEFCSTDRDVDTVNLSCSHFCHIKNLFDNIFTIGSSTLGDNHGRHVVIYYGWHQGQLRFDLFNGVLTITLTRPRSKSKSWEIPVVDYRIQIPLREIYEVQRDFKAKEEKDKKDSAAHTLTWELHRNVILDHLDLIGIPSENVEISQFSPYPITITKNMAKAHGMYAGFQIYPNQSKKSQKTAKIGDSFVCYLTIYGLSSGATKIRSIPWKNAKQIISSFIDSTEK